MKQVLKAIIFVLGLMSLVGLGLCAGMLFLLSLDGSGEDARNERFAALESHISQQTASTFQQWQYARLLQTDWADEYISPNLVGEERVQTANRYFQKALDAQLPEAFMQKGLALIDDEKSNEKQRLEGLALIRRVYQTGCSSSYHDRFASYNWYAKDPKSLGRYVSRVAEREQHSTRTRFHDELALLELYELTQCEKVKPVQKRLVNHLIEDEQTVFSCALDYVLATKVNEPDIAELIQRKITPENKPVFDKKVAWLNSEYDKRFANHPTRAMMKRAEEHVQSMRLDNTRIAQSN